MFSFRNSRLLYFLKSTRILKSIEMLSDKFFIKSVADYNKARLLEQCKDPLKANDIIEDHT